MAGGGGTRLWPLSTEARPKQFLPLLSSKSLLAETWERLAPAFPDVWVATSARHAELVARELTQLPPGRILTEPARRNSGPAILAAALRFAAAGDPVTAAVPTDQTVRDPEAFRQALAAAGSLADQASVVILAVPPTRPETDFGYVEVRDGRVLSFVEKPDPENARALASSGRHLWNAGLFVFRPSRFLAEARRVAGELVAGRRALCEVGIDGRLRAASRHLDRLRRHGASLRSRGRAARRGVERRRHLASGPRPAGRGSPTATSSSPTEGGRSSRRACGTAPSSPDPTGSWCCRSTARRS